MYLWLAIVVASSAVLVQADKDCGYADIVFIVDRSGSICDTDPDYVYGTRNCTNWQIVKNFITKFVVDIDTNMKSTKIAMVTFGHKGRTWFDFKQHESEADVLQGIADVTYDYGEWTNTASGIEAALNDVLTEDGGMREGAQRIAVIITDGNPTKRKSETIDMAAKLHAIALTFVIGITNEVNETVLKALSSGGQQLDVNYFKTPTFKDLTNIVTTTRQIACSLPPIKECKDGADIVFIVDRSGSICDTSPGFNYNCDTPGCADNCDNWDTVKGFIANFVLRTKTGMEDSHFGMVTFGNQAEVQFNLNDFNNKDDLLDVISRIKYKKGQHTNTAAGIFTTIEQLMTPQGGDRVDRGNIFIIITDGNPSKDYAQATFEWAQELKKFGRVVAVGVTNQVNKEVLKMLSSPDQIEGVNFFTSPTFVDFLDIIETVQDEACKDKI